LNKPLFILLFVLLAGCQEGSGELEWHQEEGYRWASVNLSYFGNTGFEKLKASQTNVSFEVFLTPEEIKENQMLLHGSGVAAADVDGDGLVDLYFGQLNGPNKLYKNTGNFQFEDITDWSGIAHEGYYSTGVLFADIDGDGDQDLLVNTMQGTIGVYLNDGSGHFTQVEESGLGEGDGGATLTMTDIDNDGDLDLFIANNKKKRVYDIFTSEELGMNNIVERPTGDKTRYIFKEPFDQYYNILYRENQSDKLEELGTKNKLFLNEGNGHFRDVTNEEGRFVDRSGEPFNHSAEWSLTAHFQDINGDRLPDLYVCNDYFDPDRIWINRGNGSFREIDELSIRNYSYSSMGVDVSDINRDGQPDIFVTEMLSQQHRRRARQQKSEELRHGKIHKVDYQPQYMRNSMYLNRGDHTYAEIAYYSGLEASEWSWATRFLDIDLDGYEDIVINTGFAYDSIDLDYFYDSNRDKSSIDLDKTPELNLRNKIFRNNQDLTFTEKSEDWGFSQQDVSYGLATADLDNDGDLDLVTSRFKFDAGIYENRSNAPRIGVRLKGKNQKSRIIGAEITLDGGQVKQTKEVVSGGDYLSGSAAHFAFAASTDNVNHKITVDWPGGRQSIIDSVRANRIYEIIEPEETDKVSVDQSLEDKDTGETVFEDVSGRIDHRHYEESHDDLQVQPLLPLKLSRLGPGVSWIDYDRDGDDDLFIASGRGGSLAAYENLGNGEFTSLDLDQLTFQTPSDQTTILGWGDQNGTNIVVGNANYETRNLKTPAVLNYWFQDETIVKRDSVPGSYSTTGVLASADYNGDSNPDLFVGGRFVPAHYPADATSQLLANTGDRFVTDENNSSILEDVGLVTGAIFTDFDNDGDPDLIISREWDSLLLLENNNGNFKDVTSQYGLDTYKGWWNGVAAGDFNNDGRLDFIATNWGLNSIYQLDSAFPLKMYYQDFNRDGRMEILESYYNPTSGAYVPRRQMDVFETFSSVLLKGVASHKEYANLSLQDLLQTSPDQIPSREINTLENTVFINQGDHFEAQSLPAEAQFSAAISASVADFNNDGNEDLFLSQNFFGTPPSVPRLDAGRGLLLEGDGTGNFNSIPGYTSGIKIYGEQRGAAVSDFNGDGKTDLAVSQNDTTTKLYLNRVGRRGISVQLTGDQSNSSGIGSKLWLEYRDGTTGPVREIQVGSGYWSQNSTVQVLGLKKGKDPASIQIQWYDGTKQSIDTETGKWQYSVTLD
jgi:hypothetical protein